MKRLLMITGMGGDLPDTDWITLMGKKYGKSGAVKKTEMRGKVLLSVEIVSKEDAEARPVGRGRSEPNMHPFLPKPTGRFRLSVNPFFMLQEIFGPKLCKASHRSSRCPYHHHPRRVSTRS